MIRYFKYARDLNELLTFKQLLKDFCKFQDDVEKEYLKRNGDFGFYSPREVQVLIQIKCNDKNPAKYQLMRSTIAEKIPRICRIANHLGVQTERHNYPSASGGPVIPVNIFHSVLEDHGYISTLNSTRYDTLDKMTGILKEVKKSALIQSVNPLNLISFILKTPFMIIKQTGFNTDKIENELIGKIVKLSFLLILIYGLLVLGFTHDQIIEVIKLK